MERRRRADQKSATAARRSQQSAAAQANYRRHWRRALHKLLIKTLLLNRLKLINIIFIYISRNGIILFSNIAVIISRSTRSTAYTTL